MLKKKESPNYKYSGNVFSYTQGVAFNKKTHGVLCHGSHICFYFLSLFQV